MHPILAFLVAVASAVTAVLVTLGVTRSSRDRNKAALTVEWAAVETAQDEIEAAWNQIEAAKADLIRRRSEALAPRLHEVVPEAQAQPRPPQTWTVREDVPAAPLPTFVPPPAPTAVPVFAAAASNRQPTPISRPAPNPAVMGQPAPVRATAAVPLAPAVDPKVGRHSDLRMLAGQIDGTAGQQAERRQTDEANTGTLDLTAAKFTPAEESFGRALAATMQSTR